MVKTVFLDLDDTLLDFRTAERSAISKTLSRLGIAPEENILQKYSKINRECWEMLERGEIERGEVITRRFRILFSLLGKDISPQEAQKIYEDRLSREHPFIPGAPELLSKISDKYDLYVASNGMKNVQRRRIEESGIRKYFKDVFVSELIGYNKPSRDFFEECFSRIKGFDRSCAIIVGDSLSSDILGGKNAGIKTCLYNPQKRAKKEGLPTPDYEISSLGELPPLLDKI